MGSVWRALMGWHVTLCDVSLCLQLWRPENGSGVTLWACPMHKCE